MNGSRSAARLTWTGAVIGAAGVVLAAVGYIQTAGSHAIVQQLASLIAAGLPGVFLLMVGATLVGAGRLQSSVAELGSAEPPKAPRRIEA